MEKKMTLEQVRDRMREAALYGLAGSTCQALASHLDAHITQPAQAVDVGAIRDVIAALKGSTFADGRFAKEQIAKLTAALPKDSNGAEGDWRNPSACPCKRCAQEDTPDAAR